MVGEITSRLCRRHLLLDPKSRGIQGTLESLGTQADCPRTLTTQGAPADTATQKGTTATSACASLPHGTCASFPSRAWERGGRGGEEKTIRWRKTSRTGPRTVSGTVPSAVRRQWPSGAPVVRGVLATLTAVAGRDRDGGKVVRQDRPAVGAN